MRGAPGHPYRKFGTGNRATLLQTENATSTSYASLRRALLAFHGTYYTADRMALVLLGREPLDELQAISETRFGGLPSGRPGLPRNPALALAAGRPALVPAVGLRPALLVAPVGGARRLALSWRIPYDVAAVDASRRAAVRAKAGSLVASVIGDEGAGSLLSWAREQGYALC